MQCLFWCVSLNGMKKIISFISQYFDRRIYIFVLLFGALLGFDLLAVKYSLYFYYRWIDIPVHFLGGFFLAGLYFYVVYSNPRTRRWIRIERKPRNVFTTTVLLVLATAIAWEIIEFIVGRTVISPAYWPDTIIDVAVGTLGGYIFFLLYRTIRDMIRAEFKQ